VVLTNTPLAVRRPVATAALTLMLALAQKLLIKDQLTREGRWIERNNHMGMGLTGRTLGLVGAGSIGREIARVAAPFEMRVLVACCRFRGHRDWVFHETGGGVCGDDSLGVSSRSRRFV
jgi:phosphoglycerate dehydrogenase-like enzyme